MSFRKLCHMPFRKLIPPFTLTVKKHNNSADPKLSGNKIKNLCDMTLTAGSQTSKVASRLHHKARSSHQKAKIENEPDSRRDLSPVSNITNDVVSRRSCPDSFVAKLIANSKTETLFDPTESPTLLKMTRRRPTRSKNASKGSTIQNLKMGSMNERKQQGETDGSVLIMIRDMFSFYDWATSI